MSGALHHGTGFSGPDSPVLCGVACLLGKWLHRLRYPHVHPTSCRRGMDTTERQKSRVLRFPGHNALGMPDLD
jgi:hypothetical protein